MRTFEHICAHKRAQFQGIFLLNDNYVAVLCKCRTLRLAQHNSLPQKVSALLSHSDS